MIPTLLRPKFITFTGLVGSSDPYHQHLIATRFRERVEWGLLVENTQPGKETNPKFISLDDVENVAVRLKGCLSLHIVFNDGNALLRPEIKLIVHHFERIQINVCHEYAAGILEQLRLLGFTGVVICPYSSMSIPENRDFLWIFDSSGGQGIQPNKWPFFVDERICGFAGGINIHNISNVIDEIRTPRYWIDIESGVRASGKFSLKKCEDILRKVYPDIP